MYYKLFTDTSRKISGASINTIISGSIPTRLIHQKRTVVGSRLQKALKRTSTRRRLIRYSLVVANIAILAIAISFVTISSRKSAQSLAVALPNAAVKPVDGLTSYDIAANVAKMASLPEGIAIDNQAQSAKVALAVSASDSNVIAKPQIVATALKSRKDIQTYTVQAGDTVISIAQKFGVTSDSIRWSNNLSSDAVSLGTKLTIPPVNGIVYTVKPGDTVQSLATTYKANVDQIIAYNDAEIAGIKPNEQIIIPNGQIVPVFQASRQFSVSPISANTNIGFSPQYGANGYDPGWCTYYVAAVIHIPNNWGNASTWAYFAALSGWTVSSTPPHAGVIAQTTSGNHVAVVDDVSPDGSMIKYSDMNGIAGFGRVGYSGWVPVSHFEHYIYH